MDSISIKSIITEVSKGQIRIPAFQRGYVWDAERVALLLDSLYKEYPIGSVIFWKTKNILNSERKLGPFKLPDPEDEYPVQYVLDGQQRLTSLFGVFQNELEPENSEEIYWKNVYFDMQAEEDIQDSQFTVRTEENVDLTRYFPIYTLFVPKLYRDACKYLSDDQLEVIDNVYQRLTHAQIPVQTISTEDRQSVGIVFERVNRMGVELDTYQLLTAWTWSEEFDLQRKFEDLATELADFGFSQEGKDADLLLRCCAAVIKGSSSASSLIGINGSEVRDKFTLIENGLSGAVEFLKKNLKIREIKHMPYASMLIPLSAFFANKENADFGLTDKQRKTLVQWFWISCFMERFSAGTQRALDADISSMKELKADENSNSLINHTWKISPDYYTDNRFNMASVKSKTFILQLIQLAPKSFISGVEADLEKVLQRYNRNEFHHIYPKKYLSDINNSKTGEFYDDLSINSFANFAIISGDDNRKISAKKPSEYRKMMPDSLGDILASALIPEIVFNDNFKTFINERKQLLYRNAFNLMAGEAEEFLNQAPNGITCVPVNQNFGNIDIVAQYLTED